MKNNLEKDLVVTDNAEKEINTLETSLEDFLNEVENDVDEAVGNVKITKLGNEIVRASRATRFVDIKLVMSFGDKQKAKSLNKADSILYDEGSTEKIEMKLKDNDIDVFILERQIIGSDLGKINNEILLSNETHLDLFEAAIEILKVKNGLVQTKKQIEKKKVKKA